MTDFATLYANLQVSQAAMDAAPGRILGLHPIGAGIGLCFISFGLVGMGVIYDIMRREKTGMDWYWYREMLAFWLVFFVLCGGYTIAISTKRAGSAPPLVEARAAACAPLLLGLSVGDIRWMPTEWERKIIHSCGFAAFVSASNVPGSNYSPTKPDS